MKNKSLLKQGVKMSVKKDFLKLADLAMQYFVMDAEGVIHCFDSEKEAINFIKNNNVLEWTNKGPRVKKKGGS